LSEQRSLEAALGMTIEDLRTAIRVLASAQDTSTQSMPGSDDESFGRRKQWHREIGQALAGLRRLRDLMAKQRQA